MWIWEDCFGLLEIEHTSAFLLGVYSFWNVITCLLLVVFAPSPPRSPQPDLGSVMRLTPSPGQSMNCVVRERKIYLGTFWRFWKEMRPIHVKDKTIWNSGHQGANPENGEGGQRRELVPRRSMRRYPLLRQNAVDDAGRKEIECLKEKLVCASSGEMNNW